jgi:hypothetical protein
MLGTEYPVIFSGSIYTTLDVSNTNSGLTAPANNGALNLLGAEYTLPLNPALAIGTAPYKGLGAPLRIKYVQYLSTAASSFIAAPGVVYWTDTSFTIVTGLASEALNGSINAVAGYIALNTTNYPGSLTGAQLLAAVKGNFCWIVTGGYLPAAESVGSVVAGDYLIGSASAFIPARMAANSAPTNTVLGMAATAVSNSLSDVVVGYGLGLS